MSNPDLDRAVIVELVRRWRSFNWTHFSNALRMPVFELSTTSRELGRWNSRTRTISISSSLVYQHPWEAVEEVLKHEMAHQFVDEVLHEHEESAHGRAFRSTCDRLGIDPVASGVSVAEGSGARVVEKIARLLSLAARADQHEAEAAAVAARRLMLKHHLDCAETPKRYSFKRLGSPARRVEESARILSGILTGYFFVEGVWIETYVPQTMQSGRVLEIAGTAENLAIAEFVHGFLDQTAAELWSAHREKNAITSNRDRRTFKAGVMAGFREKLDIEQRGEQARALVWSHDADLERYVHRRYPRLTNRRRIDPIRGHSFHEGRAAGKRIVLSKPVDGGPASRGRLLGPG